MFNKRFNAHSIVVHKITPMQWHGKVAYKHTQEVNLQDVTVYVSFQTSQKAIDDPSEIFFFLPFCFVTGDPLIFEREFKTFQCVYFKKEVRP